MFDDSSDTRSDIKRIWRLHKLPAAWSLGGPNSPSNHGSVISNEHVEITIFSTNTMASPVPDESNALTLCHTDHHVDATIINRFLEINGHSSEDGNSHGRA
jgi:hypothetical protein